MLEKFRTILSSWLINGIETPPELLVGYTPNFIEYQLKNLTTNIYKDKDASNISTVYTAIKILAETIARLPLNVYKIDAKGNKYVDKSDYRYSILHYNPNGYMTSYNFLLQQKDLKIIMGIHLLEFIK